MTPLIIIAIIAAAVFLLSRSKSKKASPQPASRWYFYGAKGISGSPEPYGTGFAFDLPRSATDHPRYVIGPPIPLVAGKPLTMSFPWLSQYGGAWNAAKHLGEAIKLVGKGGTTGNHLLDDALKRADADGHTQPQEVHQLQALASGKGNLRSGDGTKAGDALAKAQNAKARLSVLWGIPFSLAEQFNRRSTFIAAWTIAKEQGMADPYGFAVEAVKTTQGIYNKANRPAWSRNAIGGMAFTFKTYSINYVEMLHRMWTQGGKEGKQGVMLAMAVLFLLSGAGGLPGGDDLDDLIDGVMQRMGYNFSSKQVDTAARTIFLDRTKNGDKRQVPITSVLLALLNAYKADHDGRLFPWWDGSQEPKILARVTSRLSRQYARLFAAAGCQGLHFHDLRHEATSRIYERTTLTDLQVAKITGHRDLRTLKRYANLRGSDLAARLW